MTRFGVRNLKMSCFEGPELKNADFQLLELKMSCFGGLELKNADFQLLRAQNELFWGFDHLRPLKWTHFQGVKWTHFDVPNMKIITREGHTRRRDAKSDHFPSRLRNLREQKTPSEKKDLFFLEGFAPLSPCQIEVRD